MVKLWIGLGEGKPQAQINTQKENVTQEAQAERWLGWCSACLKQFDPSTKEIDMVLSQPLEGEFRSIRILMSSSAIYGVQGSLDT